MAIFLKEMYYMQESRNQIHLQAADFVSETFFFYHLIISNIIAGLSNPSLSPGSVIIVHSFYQDKHLKCVTLQICSMFCDA
jgi:hypothetical protein